MTRLELLAPAKNADIGIEAIRHGADAVYIGAEEFGARAAAGNSVADIARLVQFAHKYRAKVYVTVNTIIFDDEREKVERLCRELYEAGCDALIVQDLRLLSFDLPPIPLHASTQMDNRTAKKVARLKELDFNQVVLARELSTDEIAAIHHTVPDVRLEVFVHGALCVGLSGRCNASEYLFSRSANRGECAQVCRMEFDLIDNDTDELLIEKQHLLSLKDNCQLQNLDRLIAAGATSFKIEGRLKGADYVKNVTAAYSQALNRFIAEHPDEYCRESQGEVEYSFTPDVRKSFNRGFVTDVSRPDANVLTPKSIGEPITDFRTLHNGDGICYIQDGRLNGMQLDNAAGFRPIKGIQYFRNKDVEWEKMLARPTAERRIGVNIDVYSDHIEMCDREGTRVGIEIEHEPAKTPQHETIKTNLSRLGDSIYKAERIDIHFADTLFIPAKALSSYRRTLVEMMDEKREATYPRKIRRHHPIQVERERPYEETHDKSTPLMITKYCLRRQLGMCLKTKGSTKRNLALRLANGKRLLLDFDCRQCTMKVLRSMWLLMPLLLLTMTACVGGSVTESQPTADTIVTIVDTTTTIEADSTLLSLSPWQRDSLIFRLSHHYTINSNFVVKADSIMLIPREGDVGIDTCYVKEGSLIAVAAITDRVDTVWIKVAHDQNTMGWIAENELLKQTSPDDPISEILYALSGSRGIWMSIFAAIGLGAFFIRRGKNRKLKLVRWDQMQSPYPNMLLALIALMAAVYSSVQNFIPEYWQEYYFHPSLNPLVLPPIMALLAILVWLVIITFLAVIDEVYHNFDIIDGATYIFELLGVGMIVYLAISWTTLIFIGYLLLPVLLHLLHATYIKQKETYNEN